MKVSFFATSLVTVAIATVVVGVSCGPGDEASSGKPKTAPPIFQKSGDTTLGAKSIYSESLSPLKFFDNDPATFWHSGNPGGDYGWISVSFPKPFKASTYTIVRRSEIASQAPAHFILEGSTSTAFPDSGSKWEILDEVKEQKWEGLTHTYKIKKPKEYVHYRLTVLKTVSDFTHASVAEWNLK